MLAPRRVIEWVELMVAFDGISVLTSPENTALNCLDPGDLYALVGPESEGFSSWADANDLGWRVGGGWFGWFGRSVSGRLVGDHRSG